MSERFSRLRVGVDAKCNKKNEIDKDTQGMHQERLNTTPILHFHDLVSGFFVVADLGWDWGQG